MLPSKGREFKYQKCGMSYNRDLNAHVIVAHDIIDTSDEGKRPKTRR
ncbi:MAG: hypothetical protein ACTSVF_02285 [Candidatus Asgardarchaeia archaeon]